MKHSIKRMLSLLAAAVLLVSTSLGANAQTDSLGSEKDTNKKRTIPVDSLQHGQVYFLRHVSTGKYLTYDSATNNVIVANFRGESSSSQQWQYFYYKNETFSYAKLRTAGRSGSYYLDVNGSYSANNAQNTYLQDHTNVTVANNLSTNYNSSQWLSSNGGLLAKMSKYNGSSTYSSSYWKYLVPDPDGSGNVVQHGLSGLPSGYQEWVYELTYTNDSMSDTIGHPLEEEKSYDLTRGYTSAHQALDIDLPVGTPIYAVADGTVDYYCVYDTADNVIAGGGLFAALRTNGGATIIYEHLSAYAFGVSGPAPINTRGKVVTSYRFDYIDGGFTVTKGTQIGVSGNSGNSSDPHLHYEVKINGVLVDPMPYVSNVDLKS